jgi:hypothetical protein
MTAPESRSRLTGRLLAEGVVIVVSVLLALAAEAWWSGRTEAETTRQHLLALSQDLDLMRLVMDVNRPGQVGAVDAGRTLLSGLLGPNPGILADSAMGLWLRTLSVPSLPVARGSYDALIASGRFERVPDQELRVELTQFFAGLQLAQVQRETLMMTAYQALTSSSDFANQVGAQNLGVWRGFDISRGVDSSTLTAGTDAARVRGWAESERLLSDLGLYLSLYAVMVAVHEDLDQRMASIEQRLDAVLLK